MFRTAAARVPPARPRKGPPPVLVVALVVVLAIIVITVATVSANIAASGTQRVRVTADGTTSALGWVLATSADVVSAPDRTTAIEVEVTRAAGAGRVPALKGDFDGSGGGEAKEVRCSSSVTAWHVAVGKGQTVRVVCDTNVAPSVLHQLRGVYLGAR